MRYVNVMDYDAKADGVTNDLPSFLSARAAASSSRADLYVPYNRYSLVFTPATPSIHLDWDGATVYGDGPHGTHISCRDDGTFNPKGFQYRVFESQPGRSFEVRDMHVSGTPMVGDGLSSTALWSQGLSGPEGPRYEMNAQNLKIEGFAYAIYTNPGGTDAFNALTVNIDKCDLSAYYIPVAAYSDPNSLLKFLNVNRSWVHDVHPISGSHLFYIHPTVNYMISDSLLEGTPKWGLQNWGEAHVLAVHSALNNVTFRHCGRGWLTNEHGPSQASNLRFDNVTVGVELRNALTCDTMTFKLRSGQTAIASYADCSWNSHVNIGSLHLDFAGCVPASGSGIGIDISHPIKVSVHDVMLTSNSGKQGPGGPVPSCAQFLNLQPSATGSDVHISNVKATLCVGSGAVSYLCAGYGVGDLKIDNVSWVGSTNADAGVVRITQVTPGGHVELSNMVIDISGGLALTVGAGVAQGVIEGRNNDFRQSRLSGSTAQNILLKQGLSPTPLHATGTLVLDASHDRVLVYGSGTVYAMTLQKATNQAQKLFCGSRYGIVSDGNWVYENNVSGNIVGLAPGIVPQGVLWFSLSQDGKTWVRE